MAGLLLNAPRGLTVVTIQQLAQGYPAHFSGQSVPLFGLTKLTVCTIPFIELHRYSPTTHSHCTWPSI